MFSALKTHSQLFDASRMLVNDDGSIRTLYQFQQAVSGLIEDYNINYLDAERNFALSSAQQVSNWVDFQKDGDKYYIQYRTALDNKVRAEHAALEGITLPVSDAFWMYYFPPNGWNCRCLGKQVNKDKYEKSDSKKAIEAGEKATTKISASGKNSLEIFRFNPGMQEVIFPPKHPYHKISGASKVKNQVNDGLL